MATTKKEQPATNGLWKRKDAAEYCSVTERTIDRWLASGVLPGNAKVIIGGSVRFRADIIIRHIADIGLACENESGVAR